MAVLSATELSPTSPDLVLDGGERGCGDLLLELSRHVRGLAPGSVLRLVTADPGAPADLPAWCRLTGHEMIGTGRHDGRPAYDVRTRTDLEESRA